MNKLEIIDQIEITEFEIKRLKSLGANWTTTITKTIKELENKLDQLKKELSLLIYNKEELLKHF